MKVAICNSINNSNISTKHNYAVYRAILEHNGIEYVAVDINKPNIWETCRKSDAFIYPWNHENNEEQISLSIIPIIEKHLSVKCYPNYDTCWHYDDKIKQYYLLKQYHFPIIESMIFFDKKKALSWLKTANLPTVFKLKGGAGSENVILIKNQGQGKKLIQRMFSEGIISGQVYRQPLYSNLNIKSWRIRKRLSIIKQKLQGNYLSHHNVLHKNYLLFQKYLPHNAYDTRITVIGHRAFGFQRFNRPNDFRASGSGLINHTPNKIDLNCVKIAFKVSKKLNFQSMAYDFIYDENNQPLICEISYIYQDIAVYNCHGYWDENLNWHAGHYWPEYCQLADLLKLSDLAQPSID